VIEAPFTSATAGTSQPSRNSACCGETKGPAADSGGNGQSGPGGGVVGAVLLSPFIKAGTVVTKDYNHYSSLASIEDLFGLAQLHQLRGRIGRGAHDSYCILVAAAKSHEARMRLRVLEQTTDGFRIAEADLQLRGPGYLLCQQQSGMPKFRFGDLAADFELIQEARDMAARLS